MSSTVHAAKFRAMYEARGAHLPEMIRKTWWQAQQFREVVLEHISSYTPRTFATILAAVRDDWGDVGERRVWRHVRRLLCDGTIRRTPDGYLRSRR